MLDSNDVISKEDNEYYTKSFLKNNNGELFIKWNWAAFIFGPSWLCYRKTHQKYKESISFFHKYLLFVYYFRDKVSLTQWQ